MRLLRTLPGGLTLAAVVLVVGLAGMAAMAVGTVVGAVCAIVGARGLPLDMLILGDMAGNVFPLLGRAGETISHRVARLRRDGGAVGHPVGCLLCLALSRMFWFMRRDHCDWALSSDDAIASELMPWSK